MDDPQRIPNARPFDLIKQEIDDLLEEAGQWLDGDGIENEATAEGFAKMLDKLRDAEKRADAERKREATPFDIGKAEVQNRYNPLLKGTDQAAKMIKKVLSDYRNKLIKQREAEAAEVRKAAELARAEAERVAGIAGTNLHATKIAEGVAEEADKLEKFATRAESKAAKGLRMRTVRSANVIDLKVAIAHYYRTRRDDMENLITKLAQTDAIVGVIDIPGVEITETKEAY